MCTDAQCVLQGKEVPNLTWPFCLMSSCPPIIIRVYCSLWAVGHPLGQQDGRAWSWNVSQGSAGVSSGAMKTRKQWQDIFKRMSNTNPIYVRKSPSAACTVVQQVVGTVTPASHLNTGSSPGCCTSGPAPVNAPEKTVEDGSGDWSPATHMGNSNGLPDSWFQPSPGLTTGIIWRVNQWMKDPPAFPSLSL